MTTAPGDTLYGRNPIVETLKAGRRSVNAIRIAQGAQIEGTLAQLIDLAGEQDIPVTYVQRQELDRSGVNHQGVLADAGPYPYEDLIAVIKRCEKSPAGALVLILDMLQDPQNLGTLLRSAEAVGVAGVLIPAHRSASVTPAVVRASAGASEHLLIARHNLAQALIRDQGLRYIHRPHSRDAWRSLLGTREPGYGVWCANRVISWCIFRWVGTSAPSTRQWPDPSFYLQPGSSEIQGPLTLPLNLGKLGARGRQECLV